MKERFIAAINNIKKASPTVDDFLASGFDIGYAESISNEFAIHLKNEFNESSQNFISLFNKNVEFEGFSFFGFFLTEFEEYDNFIHLGNQDVDLLVALKADSEIALINGETFEVISYLAKDFEELIKIIPSLISYDKKGYLGETYTQETKNTLIADLIFLGMNKKYLKFYQQRLNTN